MPDQKVSQLDLLASIDKDDFLLITDTSANASKKIKPGQLKNFFDVREFGASPTNTPSANKAAVQAAIDAASAVGGIVWIEESLPCQSGLQLKKNVFIKGNSIALKGNAPALGVTPAIGVNPTGSAFVITDAAAPFITFDSATGIDGILFHYPQQPTRTTTPATSFITYPPTIKSVGTFLCSARFENLTFVGAWECIDVTTGTAGCQDFIFDEIYAFPISGKFLTISRCFDIPRITRCHVNPGVGFNVAGFDTTTGTPFSPVALNHVNTNGLPSFDIDSTDEFVIRDCFVFGNKQAFRITNSYGQIMQCSADIVETGIEVILNDFRKFVLVSGFSCIPSGGTTPSNRNVIKFSGTGGLMLFGCHAFTGNNAAVSNSSSPSANSFLQVSGGQAQQVCLYGCRTSSVNGVFTKYIDGLNSIASINDYGSYANNVTNPEPEKRFATLPNVKATTIELTGATLATETITPNRTITLNINSGQYKIPALFLAPPSAVLDTFTDTNGVLLTAHSMDAGAGWTTSGGNWTISNNKAVPPTTPRDALMLAYTTSSSPNIKAAANVTYVNQAGTNYQQGLILRLVDNLNYWYCMVTNFNGGSATMYRVNNGIITQTANGTISYVNGTSHLLEFSVTSANIYTFSIDGTQILTFTDTNAFHSTATKTGLIAYISANVAGGLGDYDNFATTVN